MASRQTISAWRPSVPGVSEVFHPHFTEHASPMHVHDAWTLLIVDDGAVRYDLDRHERGTPNDTVSLLPPQVPHNGSPATSHGFRKRVIYLDMTQLAPGLIGPAVDGPDLTDPLLRRRVGQLHAALATPGDELEAESRLALISQRLREHLRPRTTAPWTAPHPGIAQNLRDLLDERFRQAPPPEAGAPPPPHPAPPSSRAYATAPPQSVTPRRIALARRLLLDGQPPGEVATAVGLSHQSHLTRHFKRILGIDPAQDAR